MVYEWKIPGLYEVPAQKAGEELTRIYDKRGELEAAGVVEESRPEKAVLHPCFEWRDPVAAELWRQQQARCLIGCIVTVKETKTGGEAPTRAFVYITNEGYTPIDVALKSEDKTEALKQSAFREMMSFQQKFRTVSELAPVFDAFEGVLSGESRKGERACTAASAAPFLNGPTLYGRPTTMVTDSPST